MVKKGKNSKYRNVNFITSISPFELQKADEIFNNHEKTLDNMRPPVFWKDKPIYLQQLKKWNLEKLNKAVNNICETEILMKKNSQIKNDVIIKNLIVELSVEASTSS